ncbi:MAG: hypothetical protein VB108_02600 [Anaerolineaceae bacterium]|nr:hypothetical protein [Anaerolineaceae bacterium]
MMKFKKMSVVLVLAALVLAVLACGPKPSAKPTATPGSLNKLATVAPNPTKAADFPTSAPATKVPDFPTALPQGNAAGSPTSIDDDFSDPHSGWAVFSDEKSSSGYENGFYKISVNTTKYIRFTTLEDYAGRGNATLEMDAKKASGPDDGDFGFVCAHQDKDNFLGMGITSQGSATIFMYAQGKESSLYWKENVFTPSDQYHLSAKCQSGHYTLSVNGQQIIDYSDPKLTADGGVGFYGGAFENSDVTYYFDNFKATQSGQSSNVPKPAVEDSINNDGDIIFSDDFSNKSGNWDEASTSDSTSAYKDGLYEIAVNTSNYAQWANPNAMDSIGNAVIEVDARKLSGPDKGDFGIICGYKDNDNFHILAIANDGYAEIIRYVDGKYKVLFSKENAFSPSNQYHLIASCIDGQMSLSVNGKIAISGNSSELQNTGNVGLYGGTFDEGFGVYQFDNFIVRKP